MSRLKQHLLLINLDASVGIFVRSEPADRKKKLLNIFIHFPSPPLIYISLHCGVWSLSITFTIVHLKNFYSGSLKSFSFSPTGVWLCIISIFPEIKPML